MCKGSGNRGTLNIKKGPLKLIPSSASCIRKDRDTLIELSNINSNRTVRYHNRTVKYSIITVNRKINGTAYKNNKLASDVLTKAKNVNALRCNIKASVFQKFPGVYPQPP